MNQLLKLSLIALLLLTSCAAHYQLHPGSLNAADSVAYDALTAAQATIDESRAQYANGSLPAGVKDPLNNLIKSYDVARAAWLTYRGALATKEDPAAYLTILNQDMTQLSLALQAFKGVK